MKFFPGTNGVDTCETANYVCNSLFQEILGLAGESINVSQQNLAFFYLKET